MMHALDSLRAGRRPVLDWNNNYGEEAANPSFSTAGRCRNPLMTAKGRVVDHPMFAKALGAGADGGRTTAASRHAHDYASAKTENGQNLAFTSAKAR